MGKLSAVIGQEGVYLIRQGRNDISQELYRGHLLFIRVSFGVGQLAGAVNGHKELQFTLFCLHFSDIDVDIAMGYFLNFFFTGLPPSTSGRRLI